MKKLLLSLSLFLVSLFSFSQIVVTPVGGTAPGFQSFGTASTATHIQGLLYPHVGFILTRYTDTAAANTNAYVKWWPGAQIAVGNKVYMRSYPNADSWIDITGSGTSGTVTSVGLSMPSAFTVTNSPVTGAGTLTVTGAGTTAQYIRGDGSLATYGGGTVTSVSGLSPLFTVANATTTPTFSLISQNQNLVYASPNGSSGVPSFRALVAGDLPGTSPYTWQQTLTAGSTLTGAINTITDNTSAGITWNGTGNDWVVQNYGGISLTSTGTNSITGGGVFLESTDSGSISRGLWLKPFRGKVVIDTLNNIAEQNSLVGWRSTAGTNGGHVGYVTTGPGLSLSGGALSADTSNLSGYYVRVKDSATATNYKGYVRGLSDKMEVPHHQQYSGTGNVYFFGNSIVQGVATTSKFSTIISNKMGWTENNFGVQGRCLQNQEPHTPFNAATSITQNLADIPTKGANDKLLVFSIGVNDIGATTFAGSSYSAANFKLAYDTVIQNCIDKGWNNSEILICSPGWLTQTGFATYGGVTGTNPTQAQANGYLQAAKETATKWNVLFVDMWYSMKNNGDSTMLNADGVHPLAYGDTLMANAIFNYLTPGTLKQDTSIVANITRMNGGTNGSVLFQGSGRVAQDATNFFWDNTNKRLGLGLNNPGVRLHTYENDANGGSTIRCENAGSSSSLKYGTFGQLGSGGFGITGWPNTFLVEGVAGGGLTMSAYDGEVKFQTGNSRLTRMTVDILGNVGIGVSSPTTKLQVAGRFASQQGADVASAAGAIALGSDGNSFELTGTAAVTLISNVGWVNGSEVTLLFTSTASLTDGTANSGTDIGMELAGNTNFTGSAGATITLILSEIGGTQRWREKARSVN